MRIAIYPGSFDPITNGHLDVIHRVMPLFDRVIIAVANNDLKKPLFSVSERRKIIGEIFNDHENCDIMSFSGLLVDFAVEQKAIAIIRGLRAISDFEFEFQMALMNRKLRGDIETIFLMPSERYTYTSSRIVREIARLGGEVGHFVPLESEKALRKKFG